MRFLRSSIKLLLLFLYKWKSKGLFDIAENESENGWFDIEENMFAAIVGAKSSLPTGELWVGEEDLSGPWTIWKSFELMSIIRLWLLNVAPISYPIIKIIFDNFRVVAIVGLLASLEKTAYPIGQVSISQFKRPTFKSLIINYIISSTYISKFITVEIKIRTYMIVTTFSRWSACWCKICH